MRVETVALNKIKPNPKNPRTIKDAAFKNLVKSIKEFPEMLELREIVVDENYVVLGGNMRLRALQDAGEKQAIIKVAEGLSEDQKREFIVKDNATAFGEWNFDLLANEWSDLPLCDWGVDLPTFDKDIEGIDFGAHQKHENEDISRIVVFCPDNILADVKKDIEKLKDTYVGLVFKVMEGF